MLKCKWHNPKMEHDKKPYEIWMHSTFLGNAIPEYREYWILFKRNNIFFMWMAVYKKWKQSK